jgi:hypothetical protein
MTRPLMASFAQDRIHLARSERRDEPTFPDPIYKSALTIPGTDSAKGTLITKVSRETADES